MIGYIQGCGWLKAGHRKHAPELSVKVLSWFSDGKVSFKSERRP